MFSLLFKRCQNNKAKLSHRKINWAPFPIVHDCAEFAKFWSNLKFDLTSPSVASHIQNYFPFLWMPFVAKVFQQNCEREIWKAIEYYKLLNYNVMWQLLWEFEFLNIEPTQLLGLITFLHLQIFTIYKANFHFIFCSNTRCVQKRFKNWKNRMFLKENKKLAT